MQLNQSEAIIFHLQYTNCEARLQSKIRCYIMLAKASFSLNNTRRAIDLQNVR